MSRAQTFGWYSCLKCERTSVENFERSGRPLSSWTDDNTAEVHHDSHKNWRRTSRLGSHLGQSVCFKGKILLSLPGIELQLLSCPVYSLVTTSNMAKGYDNAPPGQTCHTPWMWEKKVCSSETFDWQGSNQNLTLENAPVTVCLPWILDEVTWDRTWGSAATRLGLSTWATAEPTSTDK
jgi:hypothetical protein